MKKNVIVSLADSNYFNLLNELIDSIKQFDQSNSVAICILDAGLEQEQLKKLSDKVDEIKSAEWDIQVASIKVKGKEWLKSQVSMAFLPKYFPNYEKYLWIDWDAWVNDWNAIDLYFKACENGKLGITQTIGPGYRVTSKVNWLIGKIAVIKSQNFKHAVSSKIGNNVSIGGQACISGHLKIGDNVKVGVKIIEGEKERVQFYEGTIIAKKNSVWGNQIKTNIFCWKIHYK